MMIDKTPLAGQGVPKDMRILIEQVLLAFSKSDKSLLPKRMDRNIKDRLEYEIEIHKKYKIIREIKFEAYRRKSIPFIKNNIKPTILRNFVWKKSNEGGQEWREGTIKGIIFDRLIDVDTNKVLLEKYRKNGRIYVSQSRRIGINERKMSKKTYYEENEKVNCFSCGYELSLDSEKVSCPSCGAYIESNFYDWQLENFEIGTWVSYFYKYLGIISISFLFSLICFSFIFEKWVNIFVLSCVISFFVWFGAYLIFDFTSKQKKKQIIRYSENILRKNIIEYLWKENINDTLLGLSLEDFYIRRVKNSNSDTEIQVKAFIQEFLIGNDGKFKLRTSSKFITLTRARYPDRMRGKGQIFEEKECPSCNGDYSPDEKGNCLYCGYSLYVQNRDWKVKDVK